MKINVGKITAVMVKIKLKLNSKSELAMKLKQQKTEINVWYEMVNKQVKSGK